ncbi:MAG: PEP-CTERM sorting domain-containing protein [Gammaproteobacteria bacterium]|nr:PEP-CTERM sorting domain-containing protein [Gammaproteobacteria bacterium]
MKNVTKLFFVISMLLSSHVLAATITWGAPTTYVSVNDVFSIDVVGTGFLSNVDGGGVNISFDQTVVNVLSVTINEVVWDFGGAGISTGLIDNLNGTLNGIMVNTFANVTGDFVVASIQMQAIGVGNSSLLLTENALNPWASGGSAINPTYVGGVIAVPVPAAVWLFGSGLLGMFGVAKRKRSA